MCNPEEQLPILSKLLSIIRLYALHSLIIDNSLPKNTTENSSHLLFYFRPTILRNIVVMYEKKNKYLRIDVAQLIIYHSTMFYQLLLILTAMLHVT